MALFDVCRVVGCSGEASRLPSILDLIANILGIHGDLAIRLLTFEGEEFATLPAHICVTKDLSEIFVWSGEPALVLISHHANCASHRKVSSLFLELVDRVGADATCAVSAFSGWYLAIRYRKLIWIRIQDLHLSLRFVSVRWSCLLRSRN